MRDHILTFKNNINNNNKNNNKNAFSDILLQNNHERDT